MNIPIRIIHDKRYYAWFSWAVPLFVFLLGASIVASVLRLFGFFTGDSWVIIPLVFGGIGGAMPFALMLFFTSKGRITITEQFIRLTSKGKEVFSIINATIEAVDFSHSLVQDGKRKRSIWKQIKSPTEVFYITLIAEGEKRQLYFIPQSYYGYNKLRERLMEIEEKQAV